MSRNTKQHCVSVEIDIPATLAEALEDDAAKALASMTSRQGSFWANQTLGPPEAMHPRLSNRVIRRSLTLNSRSKKV
jgi:hypothetical protein